MQFDAGSITVNQTEEILRQTEYFRAEIERETRLIAKYREELAVFDEERKKEAAEIKEVYH